MPRKSKCSYQGNLFSLQPFRKSYEHFRVIRLQTYLMKKREKITLVLFSVQFALFHQCCCLRQLGEYVNDFYVN